MYWDKCIKVISNKHLKCIAVYEFYFSEFSKVINFSMTFFPVQMYNSKIIGKLPLFYDIVKSTKPAENGSTLIYLKHVW